MSSSSPSGSSFGDFQAEVGKAGATLNVVGSYFVLFVSVVCGVAAIAYGATSHYRDGTTSSRRCGRGSLGTCRPGSECRAGRCTPPAKRKMSLVVVGIVIVAMGLFQLAIAKWWSGAVHRDRTLAQVGGFLTEGNMVGSLFQNH